MWKISEMSMFHCWKQQTAANNKVIDDAALLFLKNPVSQWYVAKSHYCIEPVKTHTHFLTHLLTRLKDFLNNKPRQKTVKNTRFQHNYEGWFPLYCWVRMWSGNHARILQINPGAGVKVYLSDFTGYFLF